MADTFDIRILREIQFPMAFPIMPLGAFVWASVPWKYDPASTYEVEERKIIRVRPNGDRQEFALLGEHLQHHQFELEADNFIPNIRGAFVGSNQAIQKYAELEDHISHLKDLLIDGVDEAVKQITAEDKLIKLI